MMVSVNEENLLAAAEVHAASWQESHRAFCSEAFVEQHTAARQKVYLAQEMQRGKRLYMLVKEIPVGIVSVKDDLIENLYVLPAEQRKGYGTELLRFAMEACEGKPRLWVLDNNVRARSLYEKHGFRMTGRRKQLSETLAELEMQADGAAFALSSRAAP